MHGIQSKEATLNEPDVALPVGLLPWQVQRPGAHVDVPAVPREAADVALKVLPLVAVEAGANLWGRSNAL